MTAVRRYRLIVLTALAASSGGLLLGPAPALAGKFELSSSFGKTAPTGGLVKEPRGAAVEVSTGDVFVMDSGDGRVVKYNAAGTQVLGEFTGAQTPQTEFEAPSFGAGAGVAVDNSTAATTGDVYVTSGRFVDRFKPKGTSGNEPNEYVYECQVSGPGSGCVASAVEEFGAVHSVAVDASGNMYYGKAKTVYELEAGGSAAVVELQPEFTHGAVEGVAVAGSDVYVATSNASSERDLVKLELNSVLHVLEHEEVPAEGGGQKAVTVDPSGNVYVLDEEAAGKTHVAEYASTAIAGGKAVKEFGATEIGESWGIAYSPFNNEIYVSDLENNDVDIFAEVPGPPVAATEPASAITATSARLNGSVNPEGFATKSLFEYGPCTTSSTCATSLFASQATAWLLASEPPSSEEGSGSVAVEVTARLAGLEPNETYHYQLAATSALPGSGSGGEQIFATIAELPRVNDHPSEASSITRTTVQLAGSLNPEHSETTYYFAYVDEAGYAPTAVDPYSAGTRTAMATAGEGFGDQTVAQPLVGLLPGTTYHYRLVATNQAGTVTGPDRTFTTGSGTPPVVTTGAPNGVTPTTATISGTVDPQGIQTSYEFELGTDMSYGTEMFGEVGGGVEAAPIALALQDLAAGTTYHYRVVASNADGVAYGADETFTTSSFPSSIALPPTAPLLATLAIAFPTETGTTTPATTKALTRAQKLAAALKACRKKSKGKRARCEHRARKQYAPAKAGAKTKHKAVLIKPKEA
jgi:hypothetical protein